MFWTTDDQVAARWNSFTTASKLLRQPRAVTIVAVQIFNRREHCNFLGLSGSKFQVTPRTSSNFAVYCKMSGNHSEILMAILQVGES